MSQNKLILTPVILEVSQMNITKFNQLMFTNSIRSLALEAPTKRSQHANATYRNNVGRNMLCAFGHHVATCWVLLAQV